MGEMEYLDCPRQPFPSSAEPAERTYYEMPVVKHSHYGVKTATAFFLQGIGSSSQIVATLGDLLGREKNLQLIRTGRTLAVLASPVGPMLLIASLHTPNRWYNMLRIFRPTSPMSIGVWTLTSMGLFNSLSLGAIALEAMGYERQGELIDRVFGSLAAMAGGIVAVYMGTELEETSTPVWIGAFPHLPRFITATGFSNGLAALSLASSLNNGSGETRRRLQQIGSVSNGFQMITATLMFRRLYLEVGDSDIHRRVKAVIWPSLLAPLTLRVLNMGFRQKAMTMSADVAILIGGFSILASLVLAGKKSGQVPEEYFKLTATACPRPLPDMEPENRSSGSETGSDEPHSGDGESRKPFDEVTKPLKTAAQDIVDVVKSQTHSILADGKNKVADQLTSLAHGLRETGDKVKGRHQQSVAQLAEMGAEQVELLSGYLREKNLDEMETSIKDFAGRRPSLFIGGALAAGFLLGQLFGKPAGNRTDQEQNSQPGSSDLGPAERKQP